MKILRLTSPLTEGTGVALAQEHLVKYGVLAKTAVDGIYGPVTANAAKRAKYLLGYADTVGTYDATLQAYMSGKTKPTVAMRALWQLFRVFCIGESSGSSCQRGLDG